MHWSLADCIIACITSGSIRPRTSYFYYYTDSLLNVLMFWVIMKFYQETFAEMGVSRYIRGAAVMLILLTAVFSYAVVHKIGLI